LLSSVVSTASIRRIHVSASLAVILFCATIRGYTRFHFPGRAGKHSAFEWGHRHFDAVDYDELHPEAKGTMYLFEGKSFDEYYSVTPRFCSEFGFQSFPWPSDVATYAAADQRNLTRRG
jgi:hypothetical protein